MKLEGSFLFIDGRKESNCVRPDEGQWEWTFEGSLIDLFHILFFLVVTADGIPEVGDGLSQVPTHLGQFSSTDKNEDDQPHNQNFSDSQSKHDPFPSLEC